MSKIVAKYNLGVISKNFTPKSLAKSMSQLTHEKIMEYKNNSHNHAKELSSNQNLIEIKQIVDNLAGVY